MNRSAMVVHGFCLCLSKHASRRMSQRGLSPASINAALMFGRVAYVRGAELHAIGHKEVEHYRREGIELSDYEGVQVIFGNDGTIITAYRNSNFRRLRKQLH